jgi:hypothetical protein
MKPIRLDEWALTLLNETIRADAEFQLNQRSAWQAFSDSVQAPDGIDITRGIQRQQNLSVNEIAFGFNLSPDRPGLWTRLLDAVGIRKYERGTFYRLTREKEIAEGCIRVTVTVGRDEENRLRQEVRMEPEIKKAEEIHVTGIAR